MLSRHLRDILKVKCILGLTGKYQKKQDDPIHHELTLFSFSHVQCVHGRLHLLHPWYSSPKCVAVLADSLQSDAALLPRETVAEVRILHVHTLVSSLPPLAFPLQTHIHRSRGIPVFDDLVISFVMMTQVCRRVSNA